MKTITKISAVFGAIAMLSGCASTYDVSKVAGMTDQGDAFSSALHKRYIERAEFEVGEGDWASVGFFNTRAEMAANGEIPAVQMPSDRKLKIDVNDIGQSYNTLTAALKTNAPKVAPDACALSQTWFEHWMEQSAEGHQVDHVVAARSEFKKAMPNCKGMMHAPAPMASLPPFAIYFDYNSADLDLLASRTAMAIAQTSKESGAKRITLIGHADRSGNVDYNAGLSKRRVDAVAKAIAGHDTGGAKVNSAAAGETSPMVSTADGVRETMNRRVEIVLER